MKKKIAWMLVLAALLSGCGSQKAQDAETPTVPVISETVSEPTSEATTEPTTVPTTEPVPVYRNPVNGQILEEPYEGRLFGFTIGNTPDSLPHYGVSRCDILFEAFVNGLTTRRFAMYSNIRDIQAVGGSRSMRVQWTDLCQAYDAVAVHAAGSGYVMGDMKKAGIDNIYAEQWDADFHYRDKDRMRSGYSREHCLYVRGADVWQYAESQGIRLTQQPDRDYGMQFGEVPSTAEGEIADIVEITFAISSRKKPTVMTYHPQLGAYALQQYGVDGVDGLYNNEPEMFRNVFALFFPYHYESTVYHVPETLGEGEGYFACDGRLVPIRWHRADEQSPFTFTLEDGSPLQQGTGSSYVAMIPTGSTVEWSQAEQPVTEPAEEETVGAEEEAPEEDTEETAQFSDEAENAEEVAGG